MLSSGTPRKEHKTGGTRPRLPCFDTRLQSRARRFPPPWRADKIPGGYAVRDTNGQAIAYIYSRENEAEARKAKVLTADEARRLAIDIARLPELLGKGACGLSSRARRRSPAVSPRVSKALAPFAG
jgi:hypothetical protein